MGSLLCAVCSFLDARHHNGQWLVRMEDLDPPRETPGASSQILTTLERHGLAWDDAVLYQSTRTEAYEAALQQLKQAQFSYVCTCSRKTIQANSQNPHVYPGSCRNLGYSTSKAAIRLRLEDRTVCFTDQLQGQQCQNVLQEVGDFVLKRADGLYAYQLAVVVDDAFQGVTHVVRGFDLLDNTARQLVLQSMLGLSQPTYAHIPILVNPEGEKLSKQTFARAVDNTKPVENWRIILRLLGLSPPDLSLDTLIQWAVQQWELNTLSRQQYIPYVNVEGSA